MANPYDIQYTVPEGSPTIEFPANSGNYYSEGQVITMSEAEFGQCRELLPLSTDDSVSCFPEYCEGSEGYSTNGYRVAVEVPANGVVAISEVPSIEGCKPPNTVCFHYCAPCLYVEYNADPVFDPADANAASGGSADPNPTCRDLIENGVCVQTIHMANPSDQPITVTLSYFC